METAHSWYVCRGKYEHPRAEENLCVPQTWGFTLWLIFPFSRYLLLLRLGVSVTQAARSTSHHCALLCQELPVAAPPAGGEQVASAQLPWLLHPFRAKITAAGTTALMTRPVSSSADLLWDFEQATGALEISRFSWIRPLGIKHSELKVKNKKKKERYFNFWRSKIYQCGWWLINMAHNTGLGWLWMERATCGPDNYPTGCKPKYINRKQS